MKKIFSIFVLSVSFVLFSSEVDADEITPMPNVLEHLELDDFSPLIEDSNLLYVYASQRHPGKFPKVPGRRRGKRGFPAAPRHGKQ